MLALIRASFDRWFRFSFHLITKVIVYGWILMIIATISPSAVGREYPPEIASQLAAVAVK